MSSSLVFDSDSMPIIRASEAAVSTVADVLYRLRVDSTQGLQEYDVERRQKIHGPNEFNIKEEDPLWRKYMNQVSEN